MCTKDGAIFEISIKSVIDGGWSCSASVFSPHPGVEDLGEHRGSLLWRAGAHGQRRELALDQDHGKPVHHRPRRDGEPHRIILAQHPRALAGLHDTDQQSDKAPAKALTVCG